MTTTETTAPDTWTDEIAALKARYPHVRDPILAALNLLLTDPNIADDDAKARAAMRGVRITAASINGARNLMAKRETAVPIEPTAPSAAERPARPPPRTRSRTRRRRRGADQAGRRQVAGAGQRRGRTVARRDAEGGGNSPGRDWGRAVNDVPFHLTVMGRRFYEVTMPALVAAIERLNRNLERAAAPGTSNATSTSESPVAPPEPGPSK